MQVGSSKSDAPLYKPQPPKTQSTGSTKLASQSKMVSPKTQQASLSSASNSGMAGKLNQTLSQSSFISSQNSSMNQLAVDFVHEAKSSPTPQVQTKGAGGPKVSVDPIQQLQKSQNLQALSSLKIG